VNPTKFKNKSSAVAEMGDRSRAKWAGKWGGGAVPLSVWGELGPHLTHANWAEVYPRTKWWPQLYIPTLQTVRQTDRTERMQQSSRTGRTATCNSLVSIRVRAPIWTKVMETESKQKRKLHHTRRDRSRCIWTGGRNFRSRKTISGQETTTCGLTETANTAV